MDINGGEGPGLPARDPSTDLMPLDADTHVVRRGRRGRVILGAVVVVGLLGAGAAVLARSGGEADGTAALAAAQEVVEGAEGYRFEQLSERRVVTGDPEGPGTDTTTRTVVTGTVAGPEQWHVVTEMGEELGGGLDPMELMRVGDQLYSSGLMMQGTAGPSWVAMPVPDDPFPAEAMASMFEDMGLEEDDPFADEMRLDLAIQSYLGDGTGEPAAITRVVTAAVDPVVAEERRGGGVLLRVQLPPAPELAELGPIPTVDATLVLDADHRPEQVRFTAEAGTASADVVVRFTWGAFEVMAPSDSEIDRTPWLSEEAIAELDAEVRVAPTSTPAGVELVGASVMPGFMGGMGEGDAGEDCPELMLSFGSEADLLVEPPDPGLSGAELEELYSEMRHLELSVSDLRCTGMYELDDFDDEVGGLPAMRGGGHGMWEVAIGDAMVTVFSEGFEDEELEAMLASIQPVTADALAAAIPAWVGEAMAAGEGYGGFLMAGFMGGFGFYG